MKRKRVVSFQAPIDKSRNANVTTANVTTTNVASSNSLPTVEENPERVRIRQQGARTLEYWNRCRLIMSTGFEEKVPLEQAIQKMNSAVDSLESMPAIGVDPDVIDVVFATTQWMRKASKLMQRSNDPSLYLEAFLRGAAGDPLGPTLEMNQARQALLDEIERVTIQTRRVQALISSRYEISLP